MLYEPSAAARVRRVSPVAVFRTVISEFGAALPRSAASTAWAQATCGEQASITSVAAASHPHPFFAQTNIVPLDPLAFPTNPAGRCSQEIFPRFSKWPPSDRYPQTIVGGCTGIGSVAAGYLVGGSSVASPTSSQARANVAL